jgi:hypothetical protein
MHVQASQPHQSGQMVSSNKSRVEVMRKWLFEDLISCKSFVESSLAKCIIILKKNFTVL